MDSGRNVLVSAPTGSGKTVVGEHAVELALGSGGKAFYTAPIKALSNQKYSDLLRVLGPGRVGLLTGDHSIEPEAPVVVMTTEVLRNMVYAGSPLLDGLRWVVLDEVHFLQDSYRGPVWEEVLVHTPASVRFVCLSATVSNAAELGDWIAALRGPTDTVVEHVRPIQLESLYMVGDRTSESDHMLPVIVDGRPNPQGDRFDQERGPRSGGAQGRARQGGRPHGRRRYRTPRRIEVVDRLRAEDLLPAIYFLFSRAACTDAAQHCFEAGVRLTAPAERTRIRELIEDRVAHLSDGDLDVLGYDRWSAALETGVAAHHAGMIPAFREAVEDCFVEGLVKVVFATETLALGINMPARSVVIEKLTKFNGETHEFLTPAQFTQLTGRAGRRGIDEEGTAVVLWSPFVAFQQVARLVASREFPLTSAFRPTYNMTANLVQRYDRDAAHAVLARSFAQFQADRAVVSLRRRLDRIETELDLAGGPLGGDDADVAAYVRALDELRSTRPAPSGSERRRRIERSLAEMVPGDVLERPTGEGTVPLLVLSVAFRKGGAVRVRAIDVDGNDVELRVGDLDSPPEALTRVQLPVPYEPHRPEYRRDAAAVLRRTNLRGARGRRSRSSNAEGDGPDGAEPVAYLAARSALESHPLHEDPERDAVVARHRDRARLSRELSVAQRRLDRRGSGLVDRFDAVLEVLERSGHTDAWSLTASGERLRRIYHECDLLISLALQDGLFDDLDGPSVAALTSCVTYEHRSAEAPPPPRYPTAEVRRRAERLGVLCTRLNSWERTARVPETRQPEAGFSVAAWSWASGRDLSAVMDDDMTGGDFVRNTKQLIDLLRQLGDIASNPRTATVLRGTADRLFRGVVEAGSGVHGDDLRDGGDDGTTTGGGDRT